MRTSPKNLAATLFCVLGVLLIIGSPAVVFSDAAIPLFRRVGLASVMFVTPVDAPCFEVVRVHYMRVFLIFIGAGVLSLFGGAHLFATLRRSS